MRCYNCPILCRKDGSYQGPGPNPITKEFLICPVRNVEVGPLQCCLLSDREVSKIIGFFTKIKEDKNGNTKCV